MELRLRRQRGVGLVDVMVSMVLLLVALISILPLFIRALRTNASAFDYTNVNEMARDKLEQLMNLSITDPLLLVPAGQLSAAFANDLPANIDPRTAGASAKSTDPAYPYQRTWTVELLDVDDANNLLPVASGAPYKVKRISVTVSSSRGNIPGLRLVTVTSLRRNPNPANNLQ
jgi:type II secretory pathway pseudopilin PulG